MLPTPAEGVQHYDITLSAGHAHTPLTTKGPVTRRSPEGSCLRKMARFPLKRPAKMITTVPGVRLARSLAGLGAPRRLRGFCTSSAG